MNEVKDSAEGLPERVRRLERHNARLRAGGAAVLCFVIVLLALGWSPPDEKRIEAQYYALRDAYNNVRAELSLSNTGEAGLWLHSKQGQTRVHIGESGIQIFDKFGTLRMQLGADDGIQLFDAKEKPRISVGYTDDGASGVWVKDDAGRDRVAIGFSQTGDPSITILDKNHGPVWIAPK